MNPRSLPYLRMLLFVNIGALLFGITHMVLSNNLSVVRSRDIDSRDYDILRKEPCDSVLQLQQQQEAENSSNAESAYRAPNIVHYIWYNTQRAPFHFYHLLGIMSAYKVLKPEKIYFHTDMEPIGEYWDLTKQIPSLIINYRQPPTKLLGEDVKSPMFYTSHSNVDRVKVLHEMGGIYLDLDVLVVRPFDELRKYKCVIGQEQETKACGSIIICEKHAHFLDLWLNAYLDDYRMEEWAYNSGQVPFNLANRFPHLCHIERSKLNRPNFKELDVLWGPNTFDWKKNYAVHTWYRIWRDMSPYYIGADISPENIKTMNNTFGAIARSIYYGSPELIVTDGVS